MNIVTGITSAGSQTMLVNLEDGSAFTLNLFYRPNQNGWFYDIIWPGSTTLPVPFNCYGLRLMTSPNNLRQWRNLIDFGLLVTTPDNSDPSTQTAFIDGTATVVLLNSADLLAIETQYFPGKA